MYTFANGAVGTSVWLVFPMRKLAWSALQLRGLLGRLVNGCNAALNDQARHLCLPNVHVCLRRGFQKPFFCYLRG